MKLGFRKVIKDWPVRLQICVFTVPVDSIISVRQLDEEQSVIDFGEHDIDWVSNSLIEEYSIETG